MSYPIQKRNKLQFREMKIHKKTVLQYNLKLRIDQKLLFVLEIRSLFCVFLYKLSKFANNISIQNCEEKNVFLEIMVI